MLLTYPNESANTGSFAEELRSQTELTLTVTLTLTDTVTDTVT